MKSKRKETPHPHAGFSKALQDTYQLSGQSTFLAEATRHGSAYVGLLRILRAYSFDEPITMKLQKTKQRRKVDKHRVSIPHVSLE